MSFNRLIIINLFRKRPLHPDHQKRTLPYWVIEPNGRMEFDYWSNHPNDVLHVFSAIPASSLNLIVKNSSNLSLLIIHKKNPYNPSVHTAKHSESIGYKWENVFCALPGPIQYVPMLKGKRRWNGQLWPCLTFAMTTVKDLHSVTIL